MDLFLNLVFLYFIGCTTGWCIEVVYRRFNSHNRERKWINPGFLVGPYLPLYGFGLCTLFLLARLENYIDFGNTVGNKAFLFVIMALAMTLLELIAGLIFIKGMRVKLWDYTDEWLNYQGIICPKFSLYWALLGAFYYFAIDPDILKALSYLKNNMSLAFVLGIFFGCHVVDICYSTGIVMKIKNFAKENDIQIIYEELKRNILRENAKRHERRHFFLAFKSEVSLVEHLKRYVDLRVAFRDMEEEEMETKYEK